ncbi:hypothetical protein KIPB_001522 [Kipferlia bialata]|uniref:MgsA AAA+ ATPase C-terminal domain-containing protein n=1 Tax=Kipferlia bialata TaxID=797122 RepID=A0A9K3CQ59_9EUKA|nr:hypothetical protein KIPB_001522 [Kipferlia bialata]|eukprot:g1522.t1
MSVSDDYSTEEDVSLTEDPSIEIQVVSTPARSLSRSHSLTHVAAKETPPIAALSPRSPGSPGRGLAHSSSLSRGLSQSGSLRSLSLSRVMSSPHIWTLDMQDPPLSELEGVELMGACHRIVAVTVCHVYICNTNMPKPSSALLDAARAEFQRECEERNIGTPSKKETERVDGGWDGEAGATPEVDSAYASSASPSAPPPVALPLSLSLSIEGERDVPEYPEGESSLSKRRRPTALFLSSTESPGRFSTSPSRGSHFSPSPTLSSASSARYIAGNPVSILLSGPPSCGKTTLARLYVSMLELVSPGADVQLFDEAHRLSKVKQTKLTNLVEAGHITIVLCTTEPRKLGESLIHCCTHFPMEAPTPKDTLEILIRAASILQTEGVQTEDTTTTAAPTREGDANSHTLLTKMEQGGRTEPLTHTPCLPPLPPRVIASLAMLPPRKALQALYRHHIARATVGPGGKRPRVDDMDTASLAGFVRQKGEIEHDRAGDHHYDGASCLIKSMRASDRDATALYAARMIAGNDTPMVCRRVAIHAAEDVGTGDWQCIQRVAAMTGRGKKIDASNPLLAFGACLEVSTAPKAHTVIDYASGARLAVEDYLAQTHPVIPIGALMPVDIQADTKEERERERDNLIPEGVPDFEIPQLPYRRPGALG